MYTILRLAALVLVVRWTFPSTATDHLDHEQQQQQVSFPPFASHAPAPPLRLSAVVSAPDPPFTAELQCWQLTIDFTRYPTVGESVPLGDVDNATYVVLPPRSGEGWHRPPAPMFFVLLAGRASVYTPPSGVPDGVYPDDPVPGPEWDRLDIEPGTKGLIVAVDVDRRARGHLTFYPGEEESVALQVPVRDWETWRRRWKVVGRGAC